VEPEPGLCRGAHSGQNTDPKRRPDCKYPSYPPDIRKAIYTTNAIESLNSVIRAAIKKRKVFPTDESVRKVIYLAIKDASKKWSMPIQNWRLAMSRFIIEFGDRLSDHL
jgi:putative transposase